MALPRLQTLPCKSRSEPLDIRFFYVYSRSLSNSDEFFEFVEAGARLFSQTGQSIFEGKVSNFIQPKDHDPDLLFWE